MITVDNIYDHMEGLFRTAGGYSFFVGYFFALGFALTQRLGFEHVSGDKFLLAFDSFFVALGLLLGMIFVHLLVWSSVVTSWSSQRAWSTRTFG